MAFDFKKEHKEFYMPANKPGIITVPPANYVAVRGVGDPNEEDGEYKRAIGVLYAVAYTIRMSGRSGHEISGFFEYVVPPLEGFWRMSGGGEMDYSNKAALEWISAIRLPGFVTPAELSWAAGEAARKKKLDCSAAEFLTVDEGLCVQMMHIGPYDAEPASIARMDAFIAAGGYENDFGELRLHHEIYLSDPRRTAPEKLKTVLRHPIKPLK